MPSSWHGSGCLRQPTRDARRIDGRAYDQRIGYDLSLHMQVKHSLGLHRTRSSIHWLDLRGSGRLTIMPRPMAGDWLIDEIVGWKAKGINLWLACWNNTQSRRPRITGDRYAPGCYGASHALRMLSQLPLVGCCRGRYFPNVSSWDACPGAIAVTPTPALVRGVRPLLSAPISYSALPRGACTNSIASLRVASLHLVA